MKKNNKTSFFRRLGCFFKSPKFIYGGLSTAVVCIAAVIAILINVAVEKVERDKGLRVDFSFNSMTTQSDETLEILSSIPYPVHLYALYTKGQEDGPLLELLNRYQSSSDKISWEHADVALNPGLLTKFKADNTDETISNDSLVVYCETTDRFKILSPADFYSLGFDYDSGAYKVANLNYENAITSAIYYVTQDVIPRIMILQGHGELSQSESELLSNLWDGNNMEVCYFTLSSTEANLNSDDLLAILSPTRDLMDTELDKIMDFTQNGGNLFITCDFTDPVEDMPNFSSLLRYYGIVPKKGIVVASEDESNSYYSDSKITLIPYFIPNSITQKMIDNHTDTLLLPGCRAFEIMDNMDSGLSSEILLSSGYKSYLHEYNEDSFDNMDISDDDEIGPFGLCVYSSRTTSTGDISKAFALGCSSMLTSPSVYAMTDAQEFINTVTSALSKRQSVQLNIPAKVAMRPQLSAKALTAGVIIIVVLPVTVFAAALIVLYNRKRK